ncbi:MAG: hypothetical protein ACLT38_04750 [Akkermansia sp.]
MEPGLKPEKKLVVISGANMVLTDCPQAGIGNRRAICDFHGFGAVLKYLPIRRIRRGGCACSGKGGNTRMFGIASMKTWIPSSTEKRRSIEDISEGDALILPAGTTPLFVIDSGTAAPS